MEWEGERARKQNGKHERQREGHDEKQAKKLEGGRSHHGLPRLLIREKRSPKGPKVACKLHEAQGDFYPDLSGPLGSEGGMSVRLILNKIKRMAKPTILGSQLTSISSSWPP